MPQNEDSSNANIEKKAGALKRVKNAAGGIREKVGDVSVDRTFLNPKSFEEQFEKASSVAKNTGISQVQRIRERNPNISRKDLIKKLETRYLSEVTSSGVAVGGLSAVPGVGTITGLTAALGDMAFYASATMVHVYSMLEAIDAELKDLDHERALILTVLLGGTGSGAIKKASQRVGGHWGKKVAQGVPAETIKAINKVLGRNFVTRYGTKQGIVVLGKAAPFGIGAAIGGGMNNIFGRTMLKATRTTFADLLDEDSVSAEVIEYLNNPKALPDETDSALESENTEDLPGSEDSPSES